MLNPDNFGSMIFENSCCSDCQLGQRLQSAMGPLKWMTYG